MLHAGEKHNFEQLVTQHMTAAVLCGDTVTDITNDRPEPENRSVLPAHHTRLQPELRSGT